MRAIGQLLTFAITGTGFDAKPVASSVVTDRRLGWPFASAAVPTHRAGNAMYIRDAEEFRASLETTLEQHAERPVDLLIVPDIEAWSKGRCSNAKGNPIAVAIVDGATGGWGILLRQDIDESSVRSVLDRIAFGGHHDVYKRLTTPAVFLQHLVLHELAHLSHGWDQTHENDCDDWAFERLPSAS